jgi:hypothetical protein
VVLVRIRPRAPMDGSRDPIDHHALIGMSGRLRRIGDSHN